MKSLFAKSVVFLLVLTTSRCAPGRLGTIDRYDPSFSLEDDDDEAYTIDTTESGGTTEDYTWEDDKGDDVTDETANEIPLETPAPRVDQLAGHDDTTKGQTGCSDSVADGVEGPTTSLAATFTADE